MQRCRVVVDGGLRGRTRRGAGVVDEHDVVVGHPAEVGALGGCPVGADEPHRVAGEHHPGRERRPSPGRHPGPLGEDVVVARPRSGRGSGRTAPGRCATQRGATPAAARRGPRRPRGRARRLRSISKAIRARHSGVDDARPAGRPRTGRRSSCGRYTRPRSRSSPTSRRKLVSWKARPSARAGATGLGGQRLQHRQHHLADDGGRAVHVAEQVVPRLVGAPGQVGAPSRRRSGRSTRRGCARSRTVCGDGGEHRVLGRSRSRRPRGSASSNASSAAAVSGPGVGAGEVDDVVGQPAQGVDGVDVAASLARQQPAPQ